MTYIDHSVYPDMDNPPDELVSIEDKADYVDRICAAWDMYIHPEPETFELFAGWQEVFDRFPIATSPAYHAFRACFGWQRIPYPAGIPGPTPLYIHLDRIEGRGPDPCEHLI